MTDFRMPDLLENGPRDPRSDDPSADRAEAAQADVQNVVEYARRLWETLAEDAAYLRAHAAAHGDRADIDWDSWSGAYARTLDALAGAGGDSGHGVHEARLIRQHAGNPPPREGADA